MASYLTQRKWVFLSALCLILHFISTHCHCFLAFVIYKAKFSFRILLCCIMIIATVFFLALTNNSFASTYTGKCYCKSHFPRWSLWLSYVSLCIALVTSILHQTETKKTFESSGKWFIPIPQIVLLLKWVTLAPLLARMPTLILSLLSLYQWWLELLSMLLFIFNYWLSLLYQGLS